MFLAEWFRKGVKSILLNHLQKQLYLCLPCGAVPVTVIHYSLPMICLKAFQNQRISQDNK